MSDYVAGVSSDAKKSPKRVVFVTRRTSAHVHSEDEEQVQTYPEALFRAALAVQVLVIALVLISLFFNAPLEGIANPTVTPNPAKAPWYFLGLQEMLHYFPPVVAGVLIPGLLVMALVVIPYFNINIRPEGVFLKNRRRNLTIFYVAAAGLSLFLWFFDVYVALAPTLVVAALHAGGGIQLAAVAAPVPPISRLEAGFLVDHDVVFAGTDRADSGRHVFPRSRMVLGSAMEELGANA